MAMRRREAIWGFVGGAIGGLLFLAVMWFAEGA
jgi:hypothetical protein